MNELRVPIFLAKEDLTEVAYVCMRASGTKCWKQQNKQSKVGKSRREQVLGGVAGEIKAGPERWLGLLAKVLESQYVLTDLCSLLK